MYSRKRLADTAEIEDYKVILSLISLLLAILFMAIIYEAVENENKALAVTGYCTVAAAFIIIVSLSINECFRDSSKKFILFNKSVKE